MHGDAVPLFFYSDLFLRHPETRDLFPVSMVSTRDRLVYALARIVSQADNLDELEGFLQSLGRDHRKFGALADHFPAVGTSLLATLAHFNGPSWTPGLAEDWKAAYGLVAQIMIKAAEDDAVDRPSFWEATVLAHELRRLRHRRLPGGHQRAAGLPAGPVGQRGVAGTAQDLALLLDGERPAR